MTPFDAIDRGGLAEIRYAPQMRHACREPKGILV
jgi:hypothetical protein